jgi:hypothetical protein
MVRNSINQGSISHVLATVTGGFLAGKFGLNWEIRPWTLLYYSCWIVLCFTCSILHASCRCCWWMCVCECHCVYVHYNACMYVYMYVCMYVCMYVWMYMYVHVWWTRFIGPFHQSSVRGVPRTCVLAYNHCITVYPGWLKQTRPSQKCDSTVTEKFKLISHIADHSYLKSRNVFFP